MPIAFLKRNWMKSVLSWPYSLKIAQTSCTRNHSFWFWFIKKKKTSTFNGRSTGSCICLRLDLYMPHVSLLCFYAYRLYLTCNMYKPSVRHIYDPVLLSVKVEVICYINFLACYITFLVYCLSYSAFFCFLMASIFVSAILVARNVITLYCINTRTLYHSPSTTDVHIQTRSEHY
jgi:hypothetical protein